MMKKIGEEIDREMKNLLGLLRPAPQRDEKVAAAGRQRYMEQVDGYLAKGKRPVVAAASGWSFLRRKNFAMVALTFALAFVLVASSGAGVAAAAQGTLPGEALYVVKVFGEDFRLTLTTDEAAEFDILGSYVERRYSEIDALQSADSVIPQSTADRLGEQLNAMLQLAASMDDTAMAQSLSDMQDMLQPRYQGTNGDQDRLQDQFQVKSMVQIHKQTRDSWEATALGLSDPEQFRHMYTYKYAGEGPGAGTGTPQGAGNGTPAGEGYGPGPEKQTTGTPEETGFGPGPNATATPQATGASYGPGDPNEQPENSYGPGGSYGTGTPEGDEDAQNGPGPNETEQPSNSYGPGPTKEASQEPLKKQDNKNK
jgi:hypothetical protein